MRATALTVAVWGAVAWHAAAWEDDGPEDEDAEDAAHEGMVQIPGGRCMMGTDDTKHNNNADGEGPAWAADVKPFWIDETPVTNEAFRAYQKESKVKTIAEAKYGWSFVLSYFLDEAVRKEADSLPDAKHWLAIEGASWRTPEGKGTSVVRTDRLAHPAVHIGFQDAAAYCAFRGKRLPYETEWEFAARGANTTEYPWGNKPYRRGADGKKKTMMNVWEGKFPDENSKADGYAGTNPVRAFPPNGFGVYSLVGNVWEWTGTQFGRPKKNEGPKFVLKGGSFLDSVDGTFNHKARIATRMGQEPDSGSQNTGFRCAADGSEGPPKKDRPRALGGKEALKDQDLLQEILAEEGVEGLKKYMADMGVGGDVMTPREMREKQEARKRQAEEQMKKKKH